ncbi:MAG TPA: hypothetical protein VJ921_07660 [Vicinamibacteria bacterium]|nr:hypothetical protein [Vicinamibacteria bacterium]
MFFLKTAAVAMLSIPILLLGLVASTGLVVVDVRTADGPRIVVPVPLFLARAALGFVPHEAREVEVPELGEYSDLAVRLLAGLRDSGDGVLIEVDDHDDHVLIEKIGDELAIDVSSDDEEVSVRIPLDAAASILESCRGGRVRVEGVLAALSSSASLAGTDLVHVKSDDEEVKVWVW